MDCSRGVVQIANRNSTRSRTKTRAKVVRVFETPGDDSRGEVVVILAAIVILVESLAVIQLLVVQLLFLGVGSGKERGSSGRCKAIRVRDGGRPKTSRRVGEITSDSSLGLGAQLCNRRSGWRAQRVLEAEVVEGVNIEIIGSRFHGCDRVQIVMKR